MPNGMWDEMPNGMRPSGAGAPAAAENVEEAGGGLGSSRASGGVSGGVSPDLETHRNPVRLNPYHSEPNRPNHPDSHHPDSIPSDSNRQPGRTR